MTRESNTGLNVTNVYGPRPIPDMARGVIKTDGITNELTFEFSGKDVNENLTNVLNTLPSGIRFENFIVEVQEAFVISGTTPALEIGTFGSEETNGFTISEAVLETVGISNVAILFAGTWTGTLTSNTDVGFALSGTSPVFTDAGHARVTARYVKM